MEDEEKQYWSTSTKQSMYWYLYNYNQILLRPKNTAVKLKVKQNNVIKEYNLTCDSEPYRGFKRKPKRAEYQLLNNNIGYIDLTKIASVEILDSCLIAYKNTKGLILDMRGYYQMFGNAKELLPRICDYAVQSGIIETPVVNSQDTLNTSLNRMQYFLKSRKDFKYSRPIVILINELPQSSPENLMMYIKNAKRATFIGTATTGTNGNVTEISLPGNGTMSFTGSRVLYADGSRFQNIGILPDIEVQPTIKGVLEGKDEILEKAIDYLGSLK